MGLTDLQGEVIGELLKQGLRPGETLVPYALFPDNMYKRKTLRMLARRGLFDWGDGGFILTRRAIDAYRKHQSRLGMKSL